jgi:cytoskeletal protein RodZ
VTRLRKSMLEELERRNYSQSTVRTYVRTVEDFAQYLKRPPDQLGPEHIREHQAYLFPGTEAVCQHGQPANRSIALLLRRDA